uniref:Cellobiose 2-epimerase n=1 Tax=Talaromyces marneffei PM1 TaxID=1077442 RepID=A0A093XBF3_TALMA
MSNPDYQDLLEEIAELSQGLNTPLIALRTPQNMIGRDFTPPTAPPGMSENTHAVDRASQQGVSDMEQLGYRCLDGSDPDPSKVREIRTAFDEGERIKNGPTTHIQDGPVCYEVLESGIEERGPVILGHNPDATDAGHKIAHPLGDDGISFIRLVCGAINTMVENKDGPTSEAFVIYESSHSVDHFDEDHAPSVRPAVAPYRLFELRGALRCKIRPPEGCVLVWVGFSTQPVLESKRRLDIFPFMVNYKRMELPEPGSRNGRSLYGNYRRR